MTWGWNVDEEEHALLQINKYEKMWARVIGQSLADSHRTDNCFTRKDVLSGQ